jgi:acetyl-CoA acetyltransferase
MAAAGRAAIVGIGESRVGRIPGRSALQLQADAVRAALADAELTLSDIDGVFTTPLRVERWNMPAGVVAHHFGIKPNYLSTVDLAGASGVGMISQAVQAVEAGLCRTALCVAGQNLLSHKSRDDAVKSMAEGGSAHPQFEVPYGPLVPSLYALIAQRHMHEFGTTPEQLAEVAVAIRYHASLNPNAHKRDPLTVTDVTGSRMVTTPLHVLDCAIVSDGAAAVIVTRADHAKDLKSKPIHLLGQGFGLRHSHIGEHKNLTTTGAVESGAAAFRSAGVAPADIDVAQIYDCFTITVIVELEDLGFCPKGEGGRFVEGGRIRLGGELPVTTHGGLLSGGHPGLPGGFFHVVEGVRQLRHEAGARQVENAELALVHGNGGVASVQGTLIVGRSFDL